MPKPKDHRQTPRTGTCGDGFTLTREPVDPGHARAKLIATCLRDLTGVQLIYAIRCPDGTIKIGHTRDLQARRRHFDSTPEAILAIKPGTYDDEQAIHHQLAPHRARGREYYHPSDEVMSFVNGLRTHLGVQPI